jgi:hypothetical protein
MGSASPARAAPLALAQQPSPGAGPGAVGPMSLRTYEEVRPPQGNSRKFVLPSTIAVASRSALTIGASSLG